MAITETKGRDRTKELPQRTIWRDALRYLEVNDWFTASLLDRVSISNQISILKKKEGLDFKTEKTSATEFKITRIEQ